MNERDFQSPSTGAKTWCIICEESRPFAKEYPVYTAIKRTSRAHTEQLKTWATAEEIILFRKHNLGVCEKCYRKNRLIAWLLFAVAAAIVGFCVLQWAVFDNLTGWQVLWPVGITVVAALVLSAQFADGEYKAVQTAVAERQGGHMAEIKRLPPLQPEFPHAEVGSEVVGYSEQEFAKLSKKRNKG